MVGDLLVLMGVLGMVLWLAIQNAALQHARRTLDQDRRAPPLGPEMPPPVSQPWIAHVRVKNKVQRVPVPTATTEAEVLRALFQQRIDPRAVVAIEPPPDPGAKGAGLAP